MFRRLAATLLAVLVLAVVSATPAVAKPRDDKPGKGSTPVTAPGPTAPSDPSGGGSEGGSDGGSGSGATGDGPGSNSDDDSSAKGPKTTKDAGKRDEPLKKSSASPTPQPTRTPSSTTSAYAPQSVTAASPDRSVVRASAAPAATDSGVTTLLPAPNPMLLPDGTTTNAAATPVDAEHSSSLPQALPAILIGVGLLSAAVFGTLLARRRIARPQA